MQYSIKNIRMRKSLPKMLIARKEIRSESGPSIITPILLEGVFFCLRRRPPSKRMEAVIGASLHDLITFEATNI